MSPSIWVLVQVEPLPLSALPFSSTVMHEVALTHWMPSRETIPSMSEEEDQLVPP